MRADICDPGDAEALARLKVALSELGAVHRETHQSSLGVDLQTFAVGGDELRVYIDNWSIDVEGPEAVVQAILAILSPA